ncbi:MAG: 2-oxoacid:acceptor oxidoreductase subunit alpha [Patescibacteria group bacterium]
MAENNHTRYALNWKIAGQAGEGVMVAAKIMAKICKRHGLQAFNYLEYPSLIKGGHQTGQVYAAKAQASCQRRQLDMLINLDLKGFTEHADEISSETVIISDSNSGKVTDEIRLSCPAKIIELPLLNLSKESTGGILAANMIALGSSAYLLGLNLDIAKQVVTEEFQEKGPEVVAKDIAALDHGFNAVQSCCGIIQQVEVTPDNSILVTASEAIGLGALAAGVQFYSGYPMTPSTGVLQFLASQQDRYPLVVKHAEDEIGAINHALGASFAGVRSMTGSSGGGFALMVESISLAGVSETPLVILEAQRKGPATGLPTWTEQADLHFVINAGHGDFPKIVLTPGTVAEHFGLTKLAFHLAEKYQLPVIILSDKYILESHQTMLKPDEVQTLERQSLVSEVDANYQRYQLSELGISPRTIPGQTGGAFLANSYEHASDGFAVEDAQTTKEQVDKRARKLLAAAQEIPQPYLVGPNQADVTFVSWGSTVNVLQDLVAEQQKLELEQTLNAIHLPCLWPFPSESFSKLANSAKQLVMVEANQSGQGRRLIRQQTGIEIEQSINRYDGRPFYIEDLITWLKEKK